MLLARSLAGAHGKLTQQAVGAITLGEFAVKGYVAANTWAIVDASQPSIPRMVNKRSTSQPPPRELPAVRWLLMSNRLAWIGEVFDSPG